MAEGAGQVGTRSVLFTDLVGSTELRVRLGEEGADAQRRTHDALLTRIVIAHGGTVVKGLGDGIMATFASAADAVAAAVAMQQAVHDLPFDVRVGVSIGDVSTENGDVFGVPVVEASRLCAAAAAGEILTAQLVRALARGRGGFLFEPMGDLDLKGLPEPVAACRVNWEPLVTPEADDAIMSAVAVDASGPPTQVELAYAAMGEGNLDGAVAHFSAAVREFTAAGETRQAALACVGLGKIFANFMANRVAARAWFTRAMRLVDDEAPCVEQGWVALAAIGCEVDDPAVLLERAELALGRARQFGDVNLETRALADGGLAHVQAGRVVEGMAMMDEAMALACGTADDLEAAAMSACSFFTACYYTADFARVEAWQPAMRQRGLIAAEAGPGAFISSHCDSVQGALLCHLGRWQEAERVLVHAFEGIEEVMPGSAWHPPIALADLRILQGRLAEAEALLLGRDGHMQALLPAARLHLARGDHDLACATARRGLRLMGDDRVRAAALLGVLVQAELGRGDVAKAAECSAELDARTDGLGLPALSGEAARLRARVYAAQGHADRAVASVRDTLDDLGGTELPWLKMTLHLDLARWHEAAGDRTAAVVEGRAATALLARLDVVLPAEDAALLGRFGVDVVALPVSTVCRVATLERGGSWWTAGCGDTNVRLRDTKGLRYLAELVAHPGAERHAIDLVDVVEGVPAADTGLDRRRLGDAGELLDGPARAAYRRRVEELRDDVEDALAIEDDERAAKVQTELDALVAELARAFGLGGLDRKASSVAEKARLNVTRALRAAIANLAGALPDAGAVLDRRLRTGVFCAYMPHPDDEVLWSVQS